MMALIILSTIFIVLAGAAILVGIKETRRYLSRDFTMEKMLKQETLLVMEIDRLEKLHDRLKERGNRQYRLVEMDVNRRKADLESVRLDMEHREVLKAIDAGDET